MSDAILALPAEQRKRRRDHESNDPYRLLALAVVNLAVQDARRGNYIARLWLLRDGYGWLEACTGESIDFDWWAAWTKTGCPRPTRRGKYKKREQNQDV